MVALNGKRVAFGAMQPLQALYLVLQLRKLYTAKPNQ